MAKQIRVVAAVLALAFSIPVLSQTRPMVAAAAAPTVVPASDTVQQLAPQLVDFAGSLVNFQSLVNGLALGVPVMLVTLTPEGFTQTVTFTPAAGGMTPVDIARTLEIARQNLIARGIPRPTAQQLGVALAGGSLPTALGALPIVGLIPIVVPANTATAASAGASIATPSRAAGGLAIQFAPAAAPSQSPAGAVTTAPVPRFTSDSPLLRNTSDSPLPAVPAVPLFNTSNTPLLTPSAGGPSPAAQLQNRR
jgi:hypothetical protein